MAAARRSRASEAGQVGSGSDARRARHQVELGRLLGTREARGPAAELYALLVDDLAVPFNVRGGCTLLDRSTGYDRSTLTQEWRLAVERIDASHEPTRRLANPFVLARHLLGAFDVALYAPSWVRYFAIDIDAHADGSHERVLAAVLAALELPGDSGRAPILLRSPGGGYWLYFPLDKHWPAAELRQIVEHHLERNGVALGSGRCEVFPSGVPLRAPCGRRTGLLVPERPGDYAALRLLYARQQADGRLQRTDALGLARAFVEAFQGQARGLEAWLGSGARPALWDEVWGPWLRQRENAKKIGGLARGGAANQHMQMSEGRGGAVCPPSGSHAFQAPPHDGGQLPWEGHASSGTEEGIGTGKRRGHLRYGNDFDAFCVRLLVEGSPRRGRHDAVLKLAYYFRFRCGLTVEGALARLAAWLRAPLGHASRLLDGGQVERFVSVSLHEAEDYLRRRMTSRRGGVSGSLLAPERALAAVDEEALGAALPAGIAEEALVILAYVRRFADAQGRVGQPFRLSAKVLETLCTQRRVRSDDGEQRRASGVAVEALQALGVLQRHRNHSKGRRAREYTCWYVFGSGRLPAAATAGGQPVLGRRELPEGELVALAGSPGEPPSAAFTARPELVDPAGSWWRRMFERRAFTPAEFFDAEERRVLPGPFRTRWTPKRQVPAPVACAPTDRTSFPPLGPAPPAVTLPEAAAREQARHLVDDGRRFLDALLAVAPRPSFVEVRALASVSRQPGPRRFAPSEDPGGLIEAAGGWTDAWDVYFTVNPRRERRGTADAVSAWPALWADFDCGPGKPFADKDAARSHLETLDPPPSAVVDSGGGLQAYWFLREVLADDEHARAAERAFVARVAGDPRAALATQILRLPGSWNHKPHAGGPRPVRLLALDATRRYLLGELIGTREVSEALASTGKRLQAPSGTG